MKNLGKFLLLSAFMSAACMSNAQDTYDAQRWTNSDLNGTARFVSMGGALGALGGDLSVMSSNPAGTGLYRRSDIALTMSGVFGGKGAMDHDGSRVSFDQAGGILVFDFDGDFGALKNINIGVNYQKHRNFLFNQKTDLNLDGSSQTFQLADMANKGLLDAGLYNSSASSHNKVDYNHFMGDAAYLATFESKNGCVLPTDVDDADNPVMEYGYYPYDGVPAKYGYHEKAEYGSNNQCDINISTNISDKLFLGMSFGVYDLDYSRESSYSELGADNNDYEILSSYNTSGDGYDVKFGAILRPIEDNPFRIGLAVHTPTYYRFTDSNYGEMYLNGNGVAYIDNEDFEYRYRTPWKFNASLGYTFGKFAAVGAEYEVSDLSTAKYSDFEDYGGLQYFKAINRATKDMLATQHIIRVGAEVKPTDDISLRAGYNFVSSPFKSGCYRSIDYDGVYTETDYTNWKAINRLTFGLGYKFKGGYFDVAYQLQLQKGDYYAFDDVYLKPTKINNNRSQVMATLGFRF